MIRLLSFLRGFFLFICFKSGPTEKRQQGPSNGSGSVSVNISKALIAVCPKIKISFFPTCSGRRSCQSTLLLYSSPFTGYQLATSPNSSHFNFKFVSAPSCHVPPCCLWTDIAQFHNGLNPPGPVQCCCPSFLCKQRCWRTKFSPPPMRTEQAAGLYQAQPLSVSADIKPPPCTLAAAQPSLQLSAQASSQRLSAKSDTYLSTDIFTYIPIK